MIRLRLVAACIGLAVVACGGDEESVESSPETGECGDGQVSLADDRCVPVGATPEACAPGFVLETGGCQPVLPADLCPPGMMAVPGETTCRSVAECGEGTWGDIPVDESTHYVDASYTSGGSDGTAARPWTRINDAARRSQAQQS